MSRPATSRRSRRSSALGHLAADLPGPGGLDRRADRRDPARRTRERRPGQLRGRPKPPGRAPPHSASGADRVRSRPDPVRADLVRHLSWVFRNGRGSHTDVSALGRGDRARAPGGRSTTSRRDRCVPRRDHEAHARLPRPRRRAPRHRPDAELRPVRARAALPGRYHFHRGHQPQRAADAAGRWTRR